MIQNKFINVMISSRNSAAFGGQTLTTIREQLKEMIENEKVFGAEIFKVWINEDENPQSFDERIWEKCLKEVRDADVVLVLYNGEAGWVKQGGSIGICHAEVLEAVEAARGKVWSLPIIDRDDLPSGPADREFQAYMQEQELFSAPIRSIKTLKTKTKEALQDAVVKLMQRGVSDAGRSKNNMGTALTWKRLDYSQRSAHIIKSLKEAISIPGSGIDSDGHFYLTLGDQNVLLIVHGVPDTLSISASKEYVGQPFLSDYKYDQQLQDENVIGPVHVIGTHKTVTETQARNTLGFPDATILKDTFGVYVADNVQKVQMVFITKCADPGSTKHGFQQFRDWLLDSREDDELVRRAMSRKKIVLAIANEIAVTP